jgi:hypothetical protein
MTESGPAGSIPITFQSLMMIDRERAMRRPRYAAQRQTGFREAGDAVG